MTPNKEILGKIYDKIGRVPSLLNIKINGVDGYLPEYFNYNSRNNLNELFSETEEGAYHNLYEHLKKQGEHDGVETANNTHNSKED
jgi:hypothetical protein